MALVGVLVLSALLMALAVSLAVAVKSDTELRGAFASGVTGFYAAESGLNVGMGEYRNIFLQYNVPSGSDFNPRTIDVGDREVTFKLTERAGNPQNIVIPSGELFAGLNAIQYRYIVNSQAKNVNYDIEAGVGAEFLVGYIPLFQFVAFYKNDLEILPGPAMTLQGRVHTNGDLYLNASAGPLNISDNPAVGVFTVQVSSGKRIYRGRKDASTCTGTVNIDKLEDVAPKDNNLDPRVLPCGTGTRLVPTSELALWKGSMLSGLGNIAIPEPDIIKPPISVTGGGDAEPGVYWNKADLRILMTVCAAGVNCGRLSGTGPQLPYSIDVVDAAGAVDAAKTTALHNFMSDGAWNVGRVVGRGPSRYPGTMPIFITDVPFAAGSLCAQGQPACNNALVTSYVRAPTNTIPASVLPAVVPPPSARPVTGSGAYTEFMGTPAVVGVGSLFAFDRDYRRGGFYNQREDKWMLLLNINVRDLIWWNAQNGEPFFATTDNSEGGLVIFATIAGPDSGGINNYGVRIFGSNDIPLPGGINVSADPTGVTVASDQAIYTLGDFNRGTVNGGTPRQPASIIGDSVNVLSQNYWLNQAGCNNAFCRDGQSIRPLANRVATTTWMNAAFLGGVDTTGGSNYNGGLENYPRFHETWNGQTLNYQGAFVSLGEPEHVNGDWCGTGGTCNIYDPPVRAWNFDPGFNNAANLPPLTPRFVYVQQVLFTEDFK